MDPFATVRTLKSLIHEKEGVDPSQQRIIYAGKVLEERRTLCSYSVQKESTVHLIASEAEGNPRSEEEIEVHSRACTAVVKSHFFVPNSRPTLSFVCVGQADDRAEDERAIQVRLDGWLPRTGMSCFDAATAATDLLLKLRLLDDLYGELEAR